MEYNDFLGTPGTVVKSASDVLAEQRKGVEDKEAEEEELALLERPSYDELTSHVLETFYTHKNARRESGVEQDMIDDLYQVSGKYRPGEIDEFGGSNIYMNITSTKQRGASSWIKDIIMPATAVPFEIVTSRTEDVPPAIKQMILQAFKEDEERLSEEIETKFAEAQNPEQGEQPQGPSEEQLAQMPPEQQEQVKAQMAQQAEAQKKPQSALIASRKLKEISKLRRDIEESIMGEVHKVADHDARKLQKEVEDELRLGNFENVLDDFINDFTTFPTAFMKGPMVTKRPKLTWKDGVPMEEDVTAYVDSRMNALDAYPCPGAAGIYDGDFIEHVRLNPKELSNFAKLNEDTGYKKDAIIDILLNEKPGSPFWMSNDIEEDKAVIEKRGSQTYASNDIYHGLHFWGSMPVKVLTEWGMQDIDLVGRPDWEHIEVEILLINSKVIKCRLNKDPLKRRPYYCASFHPRSGSIWGRSLPELMRPQQGMCNASARALADNMGMASGPQMSILVDRLADDGDIEEQEPFKIWQFRSDPQGNGGKPIEYFIAPSNAQELLAVYDAFEIKADDVTGVPRYALGNEKTAGAASTARGLSMMLESATKGIKGAIVNIAKGVLEPRVEFQAYLHLLNLKDNKDDPFKFNGDLNVVVKAVENITIQAAQQQLRQDLFQATSNPEDLKIIGMEGRGMMLREIFKDVNFPEDVIPDRLELKELQAKTEANEQKLIDSQAESGNVSIKATETQVNGQKEMHEITVQEQAKLRESNSEAKQGDQALEAQKIQQRDVESVRRETARIEDSKRKSSTAVGLAVAKNEQEGFKDEETDETGTK
jgi:hypothetical protein